MIRGSILAAAFVAFGIPASVAAQPTRDATRGELLYSTHCIACNTTKVHWRDRKLATDWTSLQAQVRRWQEVSGLGWNNQDIAQVARYLNALHYHYPAPD